MVEYKCEQHGKDFSKISHFHSDINCKMLCKNEELNSKIRVASIFAGCGGLDFAFHKQANIYNVVYVNDFNKDSCE